MSESCEPEILGPDEVRTLYLLRHRFQGSQADFAAHYTEHRAFIDEHIAAGRILLGGPSVPWDGGIIVVCARDRAEVDAMVASDPVARAGITDYEVTEWRTTTRAHDITAVIDAHLSLLD